LPKPRALAVTAVALVLCGALPSPSQAAETAAMAAAFNPEHLGAHTTVSLGVQVRAPGEVPAALKGVELTYPRDLGLATSDLGVAACSAATLEAVGPAACPANSHMGYGSARVEIPLGPGIVHETVSLAVLAGPSPDGYMHLLVCATGIFPVEAIVVIYAELLPGRLSITVPPIPSLPAAPYVSITEMHLNLGGHLTYFETIKGRNVPYHPAGVGLPSRCPHGGFPFAATFTFLDGTHSAAHTAVPCPRRS
jgi:hypothetical protein